MAKFPKCPSCKKFPGQHDNANCDHRFFNGDWVKREFSSIGSRGGVGLPTQGEGDLMGGQSSGYKKGDTPALNTAIKRFGHKAVRRAINMSRRGR